MAHTVIIKSIREIDLNSLQFPQVAVYNQPEDYPDKAVARVYDNGQPTNIAMIADDQTDLMWDIYKNTQLTWCPRGKEDVLSLVGVFL